MGGEIRRAGSGKTGSLREIFNEDAQLYDEARPGYPDDAIQRIVDMSGLPPGGQILEIGCGTGQITLPFAAMGYSIVAIDIGDALVAMAADKLRPYPGARVIHSSFEEWPAPASKFDLVLSARAFHWIDPDYGVAKAAMTLKSGGAIALLWIIDVMQQTEFWKATRPIREKYLPPLSGNVPFEKKIKNCRKALAKCDSFAPLDEVNLGWEIGYAGDEYLKLLRTYPMHRALPEPERTRFFGELAEAIDRLGGKIQRKQEMVLIVARRK